MAFEIAVSQAQGRVPVTVLHLRGELDASNYQLLIAAGKQAYDGGARDILLDLSNAPYMSSSGLVALQSISALMRGEQPPDPEAGWDSFKSIHRDRDSGTQPHFKLLSPQPRVDRMLDTVGFKRYLEVFTDLDAALASF